MSDAELAQALRKDLDKYIVTLKSPKLAFHWVDASDINPPKQYDVQYPATAAHYRTYVDKAGSAIYNKRNPESYDIAGPGLYMSSHPTYSRQYGGKKRFGLIVGLVKPGTKIFTNIPAFNGREKISDKLIAELNSRGCGLMNYSDILDVSDDDACTKIKQLLVGKDISFADARLYGWTGNVASEGCRNINLIRDVDKRNSKVTDAQIEMLDTFVVYSSRFFSSVYGYTHRSTADGDQLSNDILSYLKGLQAELVQDVEADILSESQISDPKIKAMTRDQIEKFSQKYIYGCEK